MADELKEDSNSSEVAKIVAILVFGGFAVSVVILSGISFANIFGHRDFGQTESPTARLAAQSLLLGFFGSFLVMPIALITGAIVTSLGYKILGKLPLWYLLVLLPVCAVALCFQNHVDGFFFTEITWKYLAEGLTPILICYLISCWQLAKKEPQS